MKDALVFYKEFSENRLEYPQYTRPVEYRGLTVPEVVRSGNHAEIDKWRREQSEKLTREKRPDLMGSRFLFQADETKSRDF